MSREPCVASACGKWQSESRRLCAPRNLILPRVRTYHTREPSRFVHALPARPLKVQGGRGSDTYADGTIKINPISLCSHPDAHPNLNREVRHSLTWHSSKSESALERFEPVAAAMLWSDGQGTLFARVAARRQKEIKRGIDTHAPRMCQFPQCKTRLPWRQAGFIIIRDIPLPEVYPLSALSICG